MLLLPIAARADLSFETETACVLAPGKFEISMAAEYQHSRDGGEFALPFAFAMGVLPRLELRIEPTPYVGIYPNGEKTWTRNFSARALRGNSEPARWRAKFLRYHIAIIWRM